ncbi:MAG: prepilin-type N-terminal cleavage/methylation domain-containing protein [Campylobacteraceae bacterium]
MKKGLSLIELVISIVVIGIVSLSFPMILTQTSNSMRVALQQEAILSAKTYAGTIMSLNWDINSDISTEYGGKAMVLDTVSDPELSTIVDTNMRAGHVAGFGRRALLLNTVTDTLSTPTTKAAWLNPNPPTAIEHVNNANQNLAVNINDMDYIARFVLSASVDYVTDTTNYAARNINFFFETNNAAADITNIKRNTISADNVGENIKIVLRANS